MNPFISVVIPNYNKAATIGHCLKAAFASTYENFEVVVVDDSSTDDSVEIAQQFPCKLIRLDRRAGASHTRNVGAASSKGEILFFIDADCLLLEDTLARVARAIARYDDDHVVIGGSYSQIPWDDTFFSTFQSIFVNYSETKNKEPDYIAAHAMAMKARFFRKSGGFATDLLPLLEDVEFSHRVRRTGGRLIMHPEIEVRHIFNFSLGKSLCNAFTKSRYWIMYSLMNGDLFTDSGTASRELKVNGVAYLLKIFALLLGLITGNVMFLTLAVVVFAFNIWVNHNLLARFSQAKGLTFCIKAAFYYTLLYPAAVWTGAALGALEYFQRRKPPRRSNCIHR